MPNLQYIGARYVPMVYSNPDDDSANWKSGVSYENLVIVTYLDDSYTSRRPVPSSVGNPADNPYYWAKTGDFNAAISTLQNEVSDLQNDIETYAESTHNILFYGAKANDATYDSLQAISDAIAANSGSYIYIPSGKFYITDSIKTYYSNDLACDIFMASDAELRAKNPIPYIIDFGGLGDGGSSDIGIGYRKKYIKGGRIYALSNVTAAAIMVRTLLRDPDISNISILKNNCDGLLIGDNSSTSNDAYVHNIMIMNTPQNYGVKGVVFNSNDNSISDSRIYGNGIEIEVNGGAQWIDNVHTLAFPDGNNESVAFQLNNGAHISNSYADADDVAFNIDTNNAIFIDNCIYYSYKTYPLTAFRTTKYPQITCNGLEMTCKNTSKLDKGIDISSWLVDGNVYEFIKEVSNNNLKFENVVIHNPSYMRTGDLLKGFLNKDHVVTFKSFDPVVNTWYKIGATQHSQYLLVKNWRFDLNGRYFAFQLSDNIDHNGNYNYDIGSGVVDGNNYPNYELGIKVTKNGEYGTIEYYIRQITSAYRNMAAITVDTHNSLQISTETGEYVNLEAMDASFTPDHSFTISNGTIVHN